MDLEMDITGGIVVPKPLKDRLGVEPNADLQAVEQLDGVLLKRIVVRPSTINVDGLWLHQDVAELDASWNRVLDETI